MTEAAQYMIMAVEPAEDPNEEGKALALRFTNSIGYDNLERLVRSMCRRIRTRPGWKGAKPREIEQSMDWKVYTTDPGHNGWPYFLYYWERERR